MARLLGCRFVKASVRTVETLRSHGAIRIIHVSKLVESIEMRCESLRSAYRLLHKMRKQGMICCVPEAKPRTDFHSKTLAYRMSI